MSYDAHAQLWEWVFEHERREDEDELQARESGRVRWCSEVGAR